ncbi:MAG: DUF167 domain-containing protein [Microthrixaceae bacterium]
MADERTAADELTVAIRVQPGASRIAVRGGRDGALAVAVTARAVDGAATDAARRAVAEALGVRPRRVRLVRGARSRDKLLAVTTTDAAGGDEREQLVARVRELGDR